MGACLQRCKCQESDYADSERHPARRSCTDVYCLIVFVAFIVGMCLVAAVAGGIGDPKRLIHGVDAWGNACNQKNNKKIDNVTFSGRDTSGLEKVFYFNFLDAARDIPKNPVVCVTKCPQNTTIGNSSDPSAYGYLLEHEGINLCRYDIGEEHFSNQDELGPALCPAKVTPHVSILNRCVPKIALKIGKSIQSGVANILDATFEVAEYSRCDVKSSWIRKVINDYMKFKKEMMLLCGLAVFLSFLMVLLIRYFACILIWTMYILSGVAAIAAMGYCWYRYVEVKKLLDAVPQEDRLEEDIELVKDWLTYSIVATVLTTILLLILLVMRSRLALVIQLFMEAGQAISKMPFILIQPLWTLLILIAALIGVGFGALYVFTAGYPEIIEKTGFVHYEIDNNIFYARWYYLFGTLWVIQFILACQQMVIAGAIAGWYFTRDKGSLGIINMHFIGQAIKNVVVYHLGTVAVGSFIIALIQLIRIILMYLQKKLKGQNNKLAEYALKALQCCFYCLEKIFKYINRNAYIMTAVFGYNFCRACHRAFTLLIGNVLRVSAINSVGTFTLFLGQIAVTALVVLIGMFFFKGDNSMCHFFIPLGTVGIFAFIIAHCFLQVYSMAIDTIFLSFCEDCEKNDGVTKPYFMSKGLMVANDLLSSWKALLILGFVSLIVVVVVSVLVCFFAKVMIWCMYIGAAASALAGTEYCWHRWYKLRGLLEEIPLQDQLQEDKQLVDSWLAYAILATIGTLFWLLLLLYMTRRFELVVEFMQESGYAFRDMPGLLIQPLWTLLVFIVALVLIGLVQLYVASAGYVQVDETTGYAAYILDAGSRGVMQYYCLLGALWVLQFLMACQQFVVAGSVSRWYFTKDKIEIRKFRSEYLLRSHKDLIRYHLGTVTLGSFLITLLQVPRVFMTFIMNFTRGKEDRPFHSKVKMCCIGGFFCFEKFMRFVNRNCYIICSIYGQNFWLSGGRVWTMLFENVIRMAKVNFVGTFTLFLGQMTIAAIVTIIGMELIQPSYALCYWYAPLLMNATISLLITYFFLNTFGMSVDTLFLCFNEDVEQNDGTDENPYYMNSRLAKNIDHKQDFELEMRRKRAAYGKPRKEYKPGRYSRVSAGDITMVTTTKPKRGSRRVSQQPEDMF